MGLESRKLFLTSRGLSHPDSLAALLEQPLAQTKAALIPNAREGRPLLEARRSVARKRAELEALGLDVFVTDLTVYRGEQLRRRLSGLPLIWAVGGNTFCLRWRMRQSGFETMLPELLAGGTLYGGESAGAICAGPSLAPIVALDEPDKAGELILEGLGLYDFFLLPHWQAPGFARAPKAKAAAKRQGFEVVTLRDGEALVLEGGSRRLLS